MGPIAARALILVWSSAFAGSDPPGAPLPDSADARAAEAKARVSWAVEGPDGRRDLVDVAVAPGRPERLAVVTHDGRVYLSTDGGTSWREILAPDGALGDHSKDEDALLDVETRLNELLDDQNGYVDPEDIDPSATSAELIADVQSGATVYERLTGPVAAFDLHPHLRWEDAERLAVARADGLWRTADDGASWAHPMSESIVVCGASAGITLCGGPGGAWLSTDLEHWLKAGSAPESAIWAVEARERGFWVGTTDGLYQTADGVLWEQVDAPAPVLALVSVGGALRLSDGDTVWWRGAGETVWNRGPDVLLAQVYDLKPSPAGNLYAAGKSGVMMLSDGEIWRRVGDELRFDAMAVAFDREGVLAASSLGLMHGRLAPKDRPAVEEDSWVPLDYLLTAAEQRNGFNPKGGALGPSGQAVLWLLPQVRVAFTRTWGSAYASTLDQGLDHDLSLVEGISIQATWQRPKYALNATDAVVDVDDQGDVNVYMSGGDNWMALGRISRRIAMQRLKDAEEISGLYQRRAELVRQVSQGGGSVVDRTHLLLRVAEIEARMDLMTDGAVRKYDANKLVSGGSE